MRNALASLLVIVLAAVLPGVASAQTPEPKGERESEIELWIGLAQDSPSAGFLGAAPGMNFALVAVRLARPFGTATASRLTTLHMEFVPAALLSPSYRSAHGDPQFDCGGVRLCVLPRELGPGLFPAGSPLGHGFSPLGITTQFRRDRALSPSVGFTGGALLFNQKVPTSRGAEFNFTATLELGLRIGRPDRTSLAVTYRLHHLSNARTAKENPGVASHLLSIGLRAPRPTAP
jgi:hypothetical protein